MAAYYAERYADLCEYRASQWPTGSATRNHWEDEAQRARADARRFREGGE